MSEEFATMDQMLSRDDRDMLSMLSHKCGKVRGHYAEVGCYVGYSTQCILSAMPKPKLLFCLDYFEPRKLARFRSNILPYGINRIVDIAGDFRGFNIDVHRDFAFVFIDHDHKLDSTVAAYEMFWPHLSPGGIMAFHDYGDPNFPEPFEFLTGLPHKKTRAGSIIAFEKE
jgi:predicted O-methyltransferase YrrM